LKFHSIECSENSNYRNCTCPSLERVEKIKYLGLHIAHNLHWGDQVAQLANKIRKLLPKLYHLRNTFSIKTLKQIYFAFVHSQLQQNILVWGGTHKSTVDPLFRLQKATLKIIYKKKKTFPTQEIFALSEILSVRKIYFYELIKDLYDKVIQNTQDKYTHETRSTVRNVIKTQKYNRSASQRYPNFLGPHIYNKLPQILRSGLSFNQLKKHLIDHLKTLADPEHLLAICT